MNYTDILNLKDKDPIDSISGKVVGIYQNKATEKQRAAGIVPQDVVLQDNNGDKLRLRINTEGMHLPQDARGRNFLFESSPNDNGKPSGLTKNVFNNNHTVNVFQDAIITGDKSMSNEKAKPQQTGYAPAEVSLSGTGRVDIGDHISAICDMVRKVDDELGESDLAKHDDYPDFIVRLATSVYIQSCKDCLIQKKEVYVPVVSEPPATVLLSPGLKVASAQNVIEQALNCKLNADEIKRLDSTAKYNWEEVYDGVADKLVKDGHNRDDVDAAFDDLKAHYIKRTKNFSSVEFCKVVLSDVASFVEAIEASEERESAPVEGDKKTDDIPF